VAEAPKRTDLLGRDLPTTLELDGRLPVGEMADAIEALRGAGL